MTLGFCLFVIIEPGTYLSFRFSKALKPGSCLGGGGGEGGPG